VAQTFTVLGICGSLRKASTNLKLLRAAAATAPEGLRIVEHPIGDLPMFNEDIEKPPPAPAAALRDAVLAADALLLVTPEYNHGLGYPPNSAARLQEKSTGR